MTTQPTTIRLRLDHDFNKGLNVGGFHEVVLDLGAEWNVHRGDEVIVSDGEIEQLGRVRCLVAVIEPIAEHVVRGAV